MPLVADILKTKAEQSVHSIDPAASVFDAMQTMARMNIGALLVVDAGQIVACPSTKLCSWRTAWRSPRPSSS